MSQSAPCYLRACMAARRDARHRSGVKRRPTRPSNREHGCSWHSAGRQGRQQQPAGLDNPSPRRRSQSIYPTPSPRPRSQRGLGRHGAIGGVAPPGSQSPPAGSGSGPDPKGPGTPVPGPGRGPAGSGFRVPTQKWFPPKAPAKIQPEFWFPPKGPAKRQPEFGAPGPPWAPLVVARPKVAI